MWFMSMANTDIWITHLGPLITLITVFSKLKLAYTLDFPDEKCSHTHTHIFPQSINRSTAIQRKCTSSPPIQTASYPQPLNISKNQIQNDLSIHQINYAQNDLNCLPLIHMRRVHPEILFSFFKVRETVAHKDAQKQILYHQLFIFSLIALNETLYLCQYYSHNGNHAEQIGRKC